MLVWLLVANPALRLAPPVMQMSREVASVSSTPIGIERFGGNVVPTKGAPTTDSIVVQGGSLKTWSQSPSVEVVQIVLSTKGRPLDANIDLWQGPDNTPCKMRVYLENGQTSPLNAVITTPRGPNTVAVRNTGEIDFPIAASVLPDRIAVPSSECISGLTTVQGGALRCFPFSPTVESVQILLQTDGLPLNARIELHQGPNNVKQVIELYTEDGIDRPFFCILKTPGSGNVVRVLNTGPIEFPMTTSVVTHSNLKEAE